MDRSQVNHYGLHQTDGGVWYLHQGRGNGQNFIGLPAPSPFEVVAEKMCPHLISTSAVTPDMNHWREFVDLYNDELFRALLPTPKEPGAQALYLNDPDGRMLTLLVTLSRLSSPILSVLRPMMGFNLILFFMKEMNSTNVSPLIVTGLRQSEWNRMMEWAAQARGAPRTVLFVGEETLPINGPVKRIRTGITDVHKVMALPLENLGALALKRWARGERVDGPLLRKEER